MKELVKEIERAIELTIEGYSSIYINYTDYRDNNWVIRVSNHPANPSRRTDNFISLVVDAPAKLSNEDNWSINEKSFNEIDNQFYLDDCGSFTEQFRSIEEMLNYVID